MDKIVIIDNYYQAWVNNDINLIEQIINKNQFGIRNFFKEVMFSISDVEKEFNRFQISSFKVSNIEEKNNVVYCDVHFEYEFKNAKLDATVVAKFVFEKNKIIKIYETLEKSKYNRIKCVVSYDGSTFHGFQIQPSIKTVQGDIEKGLKFLTGEDIIIHSSGRTDKGVHALNQVFHFDTLSKIDPNNFGRVLNSYLPDSIYIKSSSLVHKTFHSRYDVKSKEYVYIINYKEYNPIRRNYEWFVQGFDIEKLSTELNKLIGTYDFTSFTKIDEDKDMIRKIIDVKIIKTDSHLHISIIAKGFLRYMVRYLVGTLIEIARGKGELSIIDYIEMKNASKITWKAPSSGLYLKEVIYYE